MSTNYATLPYQEKFNRKGFYSREADGDLLYPSRTRAKYVCQTLHIIIQTMHADSSLLGPTITTILLFLIMTHRPRLLNRNLVAGIIICRTSVALIS